MLNTAKEVIEACDKDNIHIYDLVLQGETKALKMTEEEMKNKIREILEVMKGSSQETLEKSFETEYKMIDGFAKMMNDYQKDKDPLTSKFLVRAMAMAFSTSETNANMGTIAAAPTAGSSGIMPAALMAAKEKYGLDDEVLINGLLTSIGIGQIIGKYATFAGAEGGCQAECGSASAMAAAALVEMLGGSPEEALQAASITLINVMGLACDPIAGLVEYPCTFRNASGVMNSFISADMALAGIKSIVPFDEVCQAMGEVGHLLHESIRETGLGGLAGTKTGQKIRAKFLNIKED
ncbi:L-serine ammonia-lyase, iron-sulfur-dependent, subunit alpha [Peptoniphilus harei]|uniref:L-serine ammonia-lyase, iron-sulfur-dependent, subunit alpha n=1 Tax=Peptoniphilus harei TaxID=54005 RepID=UPI00254F856C|nr:L-serine ammonia-lyase, iron-sulfur-dependent, subunit alpha [Peptoniphilus harei]MDK7354473.1 L-serine ammonia-lyase, iron-sulfur-dependent, subunit alpha [Peptoniphilus harei]MDK7369898.1 L-serine ammonia-lyase, iron-sulfur-dependent, subunit alpha [Peptoniphilus harei]MDU5324394.1 L-serine ammonia-lyase, iron-sulfur-dependent, subunit alpha [Peptoniphilus harei]